MIAELFEALVKAMEFRDINPLSICKVDSTVGFIWFKADGQTYFIGIEKVEFDLDNCSDK